MGERLSPSTRILQLSVGNERVALLASVHKPSLPYHQPSPAGDFNLRVTDADGRSYERDFQAQGLIPARIPQAWLDPDGAWREGDTLRLPEVPVLIKLPGDLRAPLRCRVLGHGRQLGEWTVPS